MNIIRYDKIMRMYNRFLLMKAGHLYETHGELLVWFSEQEGISLKLANRVIQYARLKNIEEL